MSFIETTAAMVGGGGLVGILNWFAERKRSAHSRLRDCEDRYDELKDQCEQLSARLRAVEGNSPTYLARWLKDQQKRVVWVNDLAYLMLFVPLGLSREDVLDKTFAELLGEGSADAVMLIDELERKALADPGRVYSLILQLHPSLPTTVVLKVAMITADGLLHYEGTSFVPSPLGDQVGPLRQHMARTAAAMALAHKGDEHE